MKDFIDTLCGIILFLVGLMTIAGTIESLMHVRRLTIRLDKLEAAVAGESTTSPPSTGDAPAAALEKTP